MATTPIVSVHLDLKGVSFKPSYIPQLLADLAGQGVNSVVVEYEDVFPFDAGRGIDIAYDPSVVWSRRTLTSFQAEAKRLGIDVIPLQQCLGHLEYVLGWRRYRRLAEDQKYPSTIALDNRKARALVLEMLRQVVEAHPDSRYVHLGMDEAHALVKAAKARGADVVEVFLNYLGELCDVCEEFGKTPLIWSDMLEDHFTPRSLKLFEKFKDRVILAPWDYGSSGDRIAVGRIAGWRMSREWLDEPDNPEAPTYTGGQTFIEDLPASVRQAVEPDLHGRYFTPMFQLDLWTRLGFRVIGASAIRSSAHGAVVPFYNRLYANIRAWSKAAKRTKAMGQIGTSWARGTSWGPNNFSIDLCWPAIAEMARTMGRQPEPFFRGVPEATVERLVKTLGRCRADWRIEGRVAAEMEKLAPKVKAHRYEWDSMILMARVMELQRRAEYNVLEVDHFHANHRPVESEWQRRLDEQKQSLADIAALRARVRAHFGKRYHGEAFEEWVRDLFDLHERRIKAAQKESREKLAVARKLYAQK